MLRCVNYEQCGNEVDPTDDRTYWEATVAVRQRDAGGDNRRALTRTGRGFCRDCSLGLEFNLPSGQKSLFAS